eukprot:9313775-Alexandrium_andersonii.AAC.1
MGWANETEPERRATVMRWANKEQLTIDKINNLHRSPNSPELLHFTLVTFPDKAMRDHALRLINGQSPMFGVRGKQCYAAKNVAKFQREAGEWLRFLCAVVEPVSYTHLRAHETSAHL